MDRPFASTTNDILSAVDCNALDLVPVPSLILNSNQAICYMNAPAERLLGINYWDCAGRLWSDIVNLGNANNEAVSLEQTLESGQQDQQWWYLSRPDGERVPIQISFTFFGSGQNRLDEGLGICLHDISPLHARLQRLQHQSAHDDLTGLVNRSELEKRLAQAEQRARTRGAVHSLFFLDLDGFKRVNDGHGHRYGDQVLREVAARLRSVIRDRDTLSRIGGDEFVVLLEHCPLEAALDTARILKQVISATPFECGAGAVKLNVSVGLSSIDRHSGHYLATLVAADMACYTAKRSPSAVIVVIPPGTETQPADRDRWQYHPLQQEALEAVCSKDAT